MQTWPTWNIVFPADIGSPPFHNLQRSLFLSGETPKKYGKMCHDQDPGIPKRSKSRTLLRREITYSAAVEEDTNLLHELGYRDEKTRFFSHLHGHRLLIEKLVAHHLRLSSANACHVADVEEWIDGSFNVCVRVDINDEVRFAGKQVMIRFPLPYKVGESFCPGNADEKIRCEAGTYAWLQGNCPEIPIPQLYGYALSSGETVRMRLEHCVLRFGADDSVYSSC